MKCSNPRDYSLGLNAGSRAVISLGIGLIPSVSRSVQICMNLTQTSLRKVASSFLNLFVSTLFACARHVAWVHNQLTKHLRGLSDMKVKEW